MINQHKPVSTETGQLQSSWRRPRGRRSNCRRFVFFNGSDTQPTEVTGGFRSACRFQPAFNLGLLAFCQ